MRSKSLLLLTFLPVLACVNGGSNDDGIDTDLLCGASVAWYQNPNSTSVSNPNTANPNIANPNTTSADPNTAATQVVCCATTDLVTMQAAAGGTYACCPLPSSLDPTTDPSASCCPSNLLQDFAPDSYYYDYGYGYYYY